MPSRLQSMVKKLVYQYHLFVSQLHSNPGPVPTDLAPDQNISFSTQVSSKKLPKTDAKSATKSASKALTMAKNTAKVQEGHAEVALKETSREADNRKLAGFAAIESRLPQRWAVTEMAKTGLKDRITARLGRKNPFAKPASPDINKLLILDNVAYRPVHLYPHDPQPWQAEYVACFFNKGRSDVGGLVSTITDIIGLDGDVGSNEVARQRIADRVQIFIDQIAPARTAEIEIPQPSGAPLRKLLGPSNSNGISSQIELVGGDNQSDGKNIPITTPGFDSSAVTHFAEPEGWGVISDVDDTIKITQTTNPLGILKTTFADEAQPIPGMAELYRVIHEQFKDPVWFYLSASPYNLYPFLHQFIRDHYQRGALILRDNSWMFLGGLLQALTTGVQEYKTDRIEKIHRWFPKRKFICVGDSTQSDPESYAEMFLKHPDWIRAIYIRKVKDVDNMEQKNLPERFETAFKGVPTHAWKVFDEPEELADHLKHIAGEAHMGLVGLLQGYFCKDEKSMKATRAA